MEEKRLVLISPTLEKQWLTRIDYLPLYKSALIMQSEWALRCGQKNVAESKLNRVLIHKSRGHSGAPVLATSTGW